MISVVCWLWRDTQASSRSFEPQHVNVVQRMFARHLSRPHRFICVADNAAGFAPAVEVVKTPFAAMQAGLHRSPEGARFPSCYRRLWMFSKEATMLGERVLLIDIDLVVTRDVSPLFDRTEDFVGWQPFRDWGKQERFGGGIYLHTTGTRAHVWERFNGARSIKEARLAGFRGSDQAWISYCLSATETRFARDSGIYSIRDMAKREHVLPADARLVQFNGPTKPWASPLPWVRTHFG